jgi:FlaG/FlaF family flagellin (archaellin)
VNLRRDEEAVSDVIGSILMVGITVLMMVGLSVAVLNIDPPERERRAVLSVQIDPGSGGWGTADERLVVQHLGGEPIARADARVLLTLDGTKTTLQSAQLLGAFADGTLSIGETWIHTMRLNATSVLRVDIAGGNHLLRSATLSGGGPLPGLCLSDVTPPIILVRNQVPANVTTLTTGVVQVSVQLFDNCAGVDQANPPLLYYRVNTGSNPPFTNGGVMTVTGLDTFTRNIPDPPWSGVADADLEYYFANMADLRGNRVDSGVFRDKIEVAIPCPNDVTAPTVAAWQQAPADISIGTTGTVRVTATLADDCAGVDPAAAPVLWYRVAGGTPATFTSAGAATSVGSNQWRGTIPDLSWSTQSNKVLEYYFAGMQDLRGNTGNSVTRQDIIDATDPCASDAAPPTIVVWTQAPADVTTLSSGAVTVTATANDNCADVDETATVTLRHRLNDGTGPTFQDAAMSLVGSAQWRGTIPAQPWGSQGGKTLEYKLAGLTDNKGNVGESVLRQDPIQASSAYTYPSGFSATKGAMSDFNNLQSASDADAVARLTERQAPVGTSVTRVLSANTVVAPGGFTNGNRAYVSDDIYADASNANNPAAIRLGFAEETGSPGTITKVTLKAEVTGSAHNANWRFEPCLPTSCGTPSGPLGAPLADTVLAYDITSLRPGGGSWTWTDINNLEGRFLPDRSGGPAPAWFIDHAFVEVVYTGPAYDLEARVDFSNVVLGNQYAVEMRYSAVGDSFRIQVWDGTTWVQRAAVLNSPSLTIYSTPLTANEFAAGSPRVRFVDSTPQGSVQGVLNIEYLRVATT